MMKGFSGGPWTVKIGVDAGELNCGVHYNSSGDNPYCAVVAADGSVVADNCDYYPASLDPRNASLIAAAPCLLDALQAITNSGADAIPIKEAFEMAHRAIERATGGNV